MKLITYPQTKSFCRLSLQAALLILSLATHKVSRPKRSVIFLLLMAVFPTAKAQSVEFAPVGAEWYYGYQEIMETGYIKITAVSDTVIDGQPCVKLEKTRTGYGYYNGWFSRIIGYEYLSVSDECVGLYRNGAFHKLFDFGAEIGDTWTVLGLIDICEESHGTVKVVDKGSELVNNISLRYLRIVDDINSYWGYSHYMHGEAQDTIKVLERIGPVGSYLLPMQKCEFDSGESGVLRCYSDDETGHFNFHTNYSDINCDYINEQYQQSYQSYFGIDSTRLNIAEFCIDHEPTISLTINSADTVMINGHGYFQYIPQGEMSENFYHEDFYFREDTKYGKLYCYIPRLNKEVLLSDMSLAVGDTFSFPYEYGVHHLAVKSITVENGKKVIHFENPHNEYYYGITFCEGIFPNCFPIGYIEDFNDFCCASSLLCEYKDGEQIFDNPQYDSCYYGLYTIQEQYQHHFKVYPTNVQLKETVHIETIEPISDIALLDLFGREIPFIRVQESSSHWTIIIPNCVSGIYIIKALTKKRIIYEKIIVHH